MTRIRDILIFALCILLALAPAVDANSGPTYWEGVTASGVTITGESCPIVVEHEKLTFTIQELPLEYYKEERDFSEYSARVKAEYTFRNPTDADVTVELLFPYDTTPQYAPGEQRLPWRYAIMADGEEVEAVLRHSLVWGSEFSMAEDSARLRDSFMEHGFYSPDMTVTKFLYRPADVNWEGLKHIRAKVRLNTDPARTKYILDPANSFQTGEGYALAGCTLRKDDTAVLYAIGEVPGGALSWALYDGDKPIEGSMECYTREQTTLRELLMTARSGKSAVSEIDWYNAAVQLMEKIECGYGYLDSYHYMEMMCWYQYELTIPAGQTLVNTVTAPMYPDIHSGWEPAIYNYTYLLSPAKGWADFGTLDIEVKTPYYMTQCSLSGFSKTAEGYALALDGLPERELEFTLSTAARPDKPGTHRTKVLWIFGGAVVLIAAGVLRRKRH